MQKTIIGTYSYSVQKIPVIEAFEEIARREGTKLSPLIIKLIEEYVVKHQAGNPQHLITSSIENEDFTGFPAMAIDIKQKRAYLKKNKKMAQEMQYHLQEWNGIIETL